MTQPDTEKFRLRRFVEKLVQQGECIVHDEPIDLIDVAVRARRQPEGGLVPQRRPGEDRAGRQRDGRAQPARRRARHRRERISRRAARAAAPSGCKPIEVPSSQAPVHEVVLTGEDADLTDAAGPSPAWARRRALYLGQHRLRARRQDRLHQSRLPPHDAARAARRRHRSRRAERPARDLPGRGGEGRAAAGRLHGRQPSDRFSRRRRLDAADGRVRRGRRGARRAGAGGQMQDHRRARCRPTPRWCSRAISTSAATSSRRARTANTSAITACSSATRCST